MTLQARVIRRFTIGGIVLAGLLFLPAGSLRYWQGWLLLVQTLGFFVPGTLYIAKRDPQLTERRMRYREKHREQNIFKIVASMICFPALTLPGFDFRSGWSRAWMGGVPLWLVLAGAALVLAGDFLIFWVMLVNSFASRTIQVESGQRVVSIGPYAAVRHPMYAGIMLMLLGAPLALGSYVALPAFLLVVPPIVYRLINEEKVLRRDLPGYVDYCRQRRFWLVPGGVVRRTHYAKFYRS